MDLSREQELLRDKGNVIDMIDVSLTGKRNADWRIIELFDTRQKCYNIIWVEDIFGLYGSKDKMVGKLIVVWSVYFEYKSGLLILMFLD